MATQKIGEPDKPEVLTDYKRAKLCAEWDRIDEERIALNAQAATLGKQQAAIERQLLPQLALDKTKVIDLPRWQFGTELVPGFFSYKDALVAEIGQDELARRKSAVPDKEKFFLRDKGPAKKSAKTLGSPRARHKPKAA